MTKLNPIACLKYSTFWRDKRFACLMPDAVIHTGVVTSMALLLGGMPAGFSQAQQAQSGDLTPLNSNASASQAVTQDSLIGELSEQDPVLDAGEHYDLYTYDLQVGDRIVVDLVSQDFDTFLGLVPPELSNDVQNDDWQNDPSHSRIELVATSAGTWSVLVTSYEANAKGAYTLTVSINGKIVTGQASGQYPDQSTEDQSLDSPSQQTPGDLQQRSDTPESSGNPNDSAGATQRAEDLGGGLNQSPSDSPSSVGSNPLTTQTPNSALNEVVLLDQMASLNPSSRQDIRGTYYDEYTVEVEKGQQITLTLRSQVFDAFLVIVRPNGLRVRNDDGLNGQDAQIQFIVETSGLLRIAASSYEPEVVGQYALKVVAQTHSRLLPIAPNDPVLLALTAKLDANSFRRGQGQLVNAHPFQAQGGQPLLIQMASTDVIPHLVLKAPSGRVFENTIENSRQDLAVIQIPQAEAGIYTVQASTANAGQQGTYDLKVTASTSALRLPQANQAVPNPNPNLNSNAQSRRQGLQTPETANANQGPQQGLRSQANPQRSAQSNQSRALTQPQLAQSPDGTNVPAPQQSPSDANALSRGDVVSQMTVEGALGDANDQVAATRELYDEHTFTGKAGQTVKLTLAGAFDTYLVVTSPGGQIWENDDDADKMNQSALTIVLPEDGAYTVKATSFSPSEQGEYSLTIVIHE